MTHYNVVEFITLWKKRIIRILRKKHNKMNSKSSPYKTLNVNTPPDQYKENEQWCGVENVKLSAPHPHFVDCSMWHIMSSFVKIRCFN